MCKEIETSLDFITVDFEDGASEDCLVVGIYEIEGKKYMSLLTGVDEDMNLESDEVEGYIYEYVDVNEDEFELIDIESDEDFERIAAKIEAFEAERFAEEE